MKKPWVMEQIVKDFKWFYDKGYITARDGNAAYAEDGGFVVTASGTEKQSLRNPYDFVLVQEDGKYQSYYGLKPSIETSAHIVALKQSGKQASVHVHSPNTVALAALFEPFGGFRPQSHHLIEVLNTKWPELFRYTKVGGMVPFLEPGSKKLHLAIENCLGYWGEDFIRDITGEAVDCRDVKKYSDIVIMQRHGVLAIGDDMGQCMEHIVRLEHISTILLKIVTASGNLEAIL